MGNGDAIYTDSYSVSFEFDATGYGYGSEILSHSLDISFERIIGSHRRLGRSSLRLPIAAHSVYLRQSRNDAVSASLFMSMRLYGST